MKVVLLVQAGEIITNSSAATTESIVKNPGNLRTDVHELKQMVWFQKTRLVKDSDYVTTCLHIQK